jgi:hypothetical protein
VSGDPLRAAHHLLVDLVRDKETHATQRMLMLFDLVYHEDFEDVWRGLRSKSAKKLASSIELLENLIRPPYRSRVLALVGDAAPSQTVRTLSYEDALREIIARGGSTMRTLAQYRAVELGLDIGDVVPSRTSDAGELAASLGQRLVDRARALVPKQLARGVADAPT